MKLLLVLSMMFVCLTGTAQRTFKFTLIDIDTGKPLARKWGTILKNGERYAGATRTDLTGVGTFTIINYDSTATYQLEIVNRDSAKIKPGVYDISAIKYSQPVIKVKTLNYSYPYGCGQILYVGYRPKEATSFDELPPVIQKQVKHYLTKRVGAKFYPNLVLNGGQIINIKRFHQLRPLYKSEPPAYSLCYMVWDSVKHLNLYSFRLKLDSNGKLIDKVQLPDIKHEPLKARFLTLDEAKAIAIKNNVYREGTYTETYYSAEYDCVVREFSQDDPEPGKTENDKIETRLLINAHTGAIVSKTSKHIYVMY